MNSVNERFRTIFKENMPLLRVIAKRREIPYDEIDDIVQETFASFYSHYAGALLEMSDEAAKRILVVTLKNRCIDYFRRQETHPVDYFDLETIQAQRFNVGAEKDEALHVLLKKQEYQDVLNALKRMKRDWAEIFVLLVIEERPVAEVSEMLGISQEACRTRLWRARKYLREELQSYRPVTVKEEKTKVWEKLLTTSKTPLPRGVPKNA